MAQGKAFTPEEKSAAIESLQSYLEMGFSRNKACSFVGLDPTTLSKWVKEDNGLSMKLTGWENKLSALALANVYQAIQNETILTNEKGDVRVDNSWKLLSKKEDGYKDKLDVTSNDKELPKPIISLDVLRRNNSSQEDSGTEQED